MELLSTGLPFFVISSAPVFSPRRSREKRSVFLLVLLRSLHIVPMSPLLHGRFRLLPCSWPVQAKDRQIQCNQNDDDNDTHNNKDQRLDQAHDGGKLRFHILFKKFRD